jgi:hypothetical protein
MELRVSAKNLGHLALPDHCPRCFWLQIKSGFKMPYQIFPGIFSSIDSYSKKITNTYFDKHRRIPRWFSKFGDLGQPLDVPHHSKFQYYDAETDILLTGVPDEMLKANDERLTILDYKTARFTNNQDSLLPVYRTQLNGYALIAEHLGLGKVTGLGLVYYEPETEVNPANIDDLTMDDGFQMRFKAKVVQIDFNLAMIPPLLRKARELFDLPNPPEGKEGCRDCRLMMQVINLCTESIEPCI